MKKQKKYGYFECVSTSQELSKIGQIHRVPKRLIDLYWENPTWYKPVSKKDWVIQEAIKNQYKRLNKMRLRSLSGKNQYLK